MNSVAAYGSFKRYASDVIAANSYVAISGRDALVVDPNLNPQIVEDLRQYSVSDVHVVLTHEHPDHTCGVPALEEVFNVKLSCSKCCAELISEAKNNMPTLVAMMYVARFGEKGKVLAKRLLKHWKPYRCEVTHVFADGEKFTWCNHQAEVTYTPGHSIGSCCIEFDGEYVFTGDSLLRDVPVITRLPGGDMDAFKHDTLPFLGSLVGRSIALPGHGEPFMITDDILKGAST